MLLGFVVDGDASVPDALILGLQGALSGFLIPVLSSGVSVPGSMSLPFSSGVSQLSFLNSVSSSGFSGPAFLI